MYHTNMGAVSPPVIKKDQARKRIKSLQVTINHLETTRSQQEIKDLQVKTVHPVTGNHRAEGSLLTTGNRETENLTAKEATSGKPFTPLVNQAPINICIITRTEIAMTPANQGGHGVQAGVPNGLIALDTPDGPAVQTAQDIQDVQTVPIVHAADHLEIQGIHEGLTGQIDPEITTAVIQEVPGTLVRRVHGISAATLESIKCSNAHAVNIDLLIKGGWKNIVDDAVHFVSRLSLICIGQAD
ncbi:hypothetical protein EV207_1241 [Scopulibacillus darangshiensis]|uniref:Uncharacterized protein n=1 Tax=Scopulibacillus darangshiensis TaxID=442528 RepID=A0A4R2NSQ2_9BACL|nr:hypothetical protein [Scopulibacillus darangshiensis]TCP24504.1 hypothetical protein EV207_1241 [Scopulibacillus darangshiensis]